jgi:hypothetical protein
MRSDIVPGAIFPDYVLGDHNRASERKSEGAVANDERKSNHAD